MGIDQSDVNSAKSILLPDEKVQLTVRQRRVGPGGSVTVPTSVIATDKRLIIVNKATLGIRKDYEVILYKQITSVRLEKGVISSSVFIRVQGYDRDQGLLQGGKEEGEIDGLNNTDAKLLSDYVNQMVVSQTEGGGSEDDENAAGSVFCSKCGAKNPAGAKFCSKCGAKLA